MATDPESLMAQAAMCWVSKTDLCPESCNRHHGLRKSRICESSVTTCRTAPNQQLGCRHGITSNGYSHFQGAVEAEERQGDAPKELAVNQVKQIFVILGSPSSLT